MKKRISYLTISYIFIFLCSCTTKEEDEKRFYNLRCLIDDSIVLDTLNNPKFSLFYNNAEVRLGEYLNDFLTKIDKGDSIIFVGSQYIGNNPPALITSQWQRVDSIQNISVGETYCFVDSILRCYIFHFVEKDKKVKHITSRYPIDLLKNKPNIIPSYFTPPNSTSITLDQMDSLKIKNYSLTIQKIEGLLDVDLEGDTVATETGFKVIVEFFVDSKPDRNCFWDIKGRW